MGGTIFINIHQSVFLIAQQNKDLHRDVRITILQEATVLLQNKNLGDMAWAIIDSAVNYPNAEVQTAIIGIQLITILTLFIISLCHVNSITGSTITTRYDNSLFQQRRYKKYLGVLRKIDIPERHRDRFAKSVILKLATSAKEDDVKVMKERYSMKLEETNKNVDVSQDISWGLVRVYC